MLCLSRVYEARDVGKMQGNSPTLKNLVMGPYTCNILLYFPQMILFVDGLYISWYDKTN